MLDPWIIEEILRREDESKRRHEQTRVEVPLDVPRYHERDNSTPAAEETERGVTIIDM